MVVRVGTVEAVMPVKSNYKNSRIVSAAKSMQAKRLFFKTGVSFQISTSS